MAKEQGREFFTGDPQSLYPDKLDSFKEEMAANNWEQGQDQEELFELAMHPEQYRALKSGKAKADFETELAQEKAKKNAPATPAQLEPQTVQVEVNGETFMVKIGYSGNASVEATKSETPASIAPTGEVETVTAPLEGKFFLTNNSSDKPVKVGDVIKKGDLLCYIESMKTYNAISSDKDGKVVEICFVNGDAVQEDDVLFKLQ